MSDYYLIYIGKNKGTIPGVPARDLTQAEAENYGVDKLLATKLYVKPQKNLSEMIIISEDFEKPLKRTKRKKEGN